MLSAFIRRNKSRSEMTFLEHLDDLRVSLLRVLGVFAIGMVAALIFYRETPALLNLPLQWAKHPETSPIGAIMSTFQTPMKVNSLSSPMLTSPGSGWLRMAPIGDVSGCLAHWRGRLSRAGVSR